ncbi:MAG: ATP-dependent zinc metalloprotease FtsH [Armatimonadetes bacterium]|nr:ATP-dependent zinc metalloprotease FtsH [Armatimonadota bacterium]NIM24634.1 ATP-dependent zinc metalloprotease FtsH [Armatimonadota bacterium]NIM68513.1 ATP-dependent zinc metalloprotease FtsH [Armatimonadota bacterium]NIM76895.1 ATP-dependent zinc metalloprotease FtsH [Armatimonadota bacterium]NIN06707.1 ATP-dependent zinc metalloprotease FtsH [Armatimonadota bacterium]
MFKVMMWFAIIAMVLLLVYKSQQLREQTVDLKYDAFMDMVRRDAIAPGLTIHRDTVKGKLATTNQQFRVQLPDDKALIAPDFQEIMQHAEGVQFEGPSAAENWTPHLLIFLFTGLLFVGFWVFMLRQSQSAGGQAFAFGRSRAKRFGEGSEKVTFEDVAGAEEAKEELEEVVDFLKNPKKFQALGAKIPKGVLLTGPPGCGKTLLARAVAGEAGVPFFHISGSDFVEMFVGVGASRVRDLFEQAKANPPCIVFIDEIDAVGRRRFAGVGGGHDEREQTLNQLLVEMDGFEPNSGVILVAATNREDVLDPALTRPGRFDRRIVVDAPDLRGREAILKVHAKEKPLAEDVDMNVLARHTPGFNGADLANLINEAALLAARRDLPKIAMNELQDSVERVIAGPERRARILSDKEKEITAYHEVGHAILAELLPLADPVHKVSILSRGPALGYTIQLPLDDRYLVSRRELLDKITGLMGGRVAEQLRFQETTTGAATDLEQATEIARNMVLRLGMSEKLGPLAFGRRNQQVFLGQELGELHERRYSEDVARLVDEEITSIVEECYTKAKELLSENSEKAAMIVEILLERETLTGEEIRALMRGETLPPLVRPEPKPEPAKPSAEPERPAAAPKPKPAPEQPQTA